MSSAPRGGILYRYVPGTGRVAALDCCGSTGSNVTSTCATAYSTSDQTLSTGTATNIIHNTIPFSYGITVTTGGSGNFKVTSAGIYKIIPSIQYICNTGNASLTIWIKVNGSNVSDTSTYTVVKNGEEGVITTEYLLDLNNNDEIQVYGLATSHDIVINYINGGGSGANTYPAAPGVITNIYRIR